MEQKLWGSATDVLVTHAKLQGACRSRNAVSGSVPDISYITFAFSRPLRQAAISY